MSHREVRDDYEWEAEQQELFFADMEEEDPDRAILDEVGMDLSDADK